MSTREQQREKVVALLAEHLLDTGLSQTSLRQLASAAGVSDRMLLYYFPDKAAVMTAAIERVAGSLMAALAYLVPEGVTLPPPALLSQLATMTLREDMQPVFRVRVEIVAAARSGEPFATLAATILSGFREWVAARLDLPAGADRAATAVAILAIVDGLALVGICSGTDTAQGAATAIDQLLQG
ncbi:MAG: TetR/AcrR family transcriptional regulator [Novosphingobium sp.]|nr:TetR/AcrR family transcriptional regulator [Novosphingobium sp.]